MKKIFFILPLFVVGYFSYSYWQQAEPAAGINPDALVIAVKADEVREENMASIVHAFGGLFARNDADLRNEVAAEVQEIAFKEGQWLETATPIIRLASEAQQAALIKARSEAELSKLEYERQLRLFKKQVIAASELDLAKSTLESRQADVRLAEVQLEKTLVMAPFAGRLGKIGVSVGDYVPAGTELVNIVDRRNLRVQYNVPERLLSQLQLEQKVEFISQAFAGETFHGKVAFIAPKIDAITRNILVEASLPNEDEKLYPGLSGQVTQVLGEEQAVLTVPEESILSSIEGQAVFRIEKTQEEQLRVERQLITIGSRRNGRVPVLSGLKLGDKIVTQGQQKLRDGQFVQIIDEPSA